MSLLITRYTCTWKKFFYLYFSKSNISRTNRYWLKKYREEVWFSPLSKGWSQSCVNDSNLCLFLLLSSKCLPISPSDNLFSSPKLENSSKSIIDSTLCNNNNLLKVDEVRIWGLSFSTSIKLLRQRSNKWKNAYWWNKYLNVKEFSF